MEIKITKYDKEVVVDNGSGTVEKYSVTLSKDGGAQNHPDLDRHEVVGKVTEFLYE